MTHLFLKVIFGVFVSISVAYACADQTTKTRFTGNSKMLHYATMYVPVKNTDTNLGKTLKNSFIRSAVISRSI